MVTTANTNDPEWTNFPNISIEPKNICAAPTKANEKTGNGTSLSITTLRFSWKKKTLASPGNKK